MSGLFDGGWFFCQIDEISRVLAHHFLKFEVVCELNDMFLFIKIKIKYYNGI